MGKNTTIRKAIRGQLDKNPGLEKLLPYVKGNVGFVFTNADLPAIRDIIQANKVHFAMGKSGVHEDTYDEDVGVKHVTEFSVLTFSTLPSY